MEHCKTLWRLSTVILFLPLGISYLYASTTSKNPGPLDPASVKNEDDTSPRSVSLKVDDEAKVDVLKLRLSSKHLFHSSQKPTRKLAASAFKFASWLFRSLLKSV